MLSYEQARREHRGSAGSGRDTLNVWDPRLYCLCSLTWATAHLGPGVPTQKREQRCAVSKVVNIWTVACQCSFPSFPEKRGLLVKYVGCDSATVFVAIVQHSVVHIVCTALCAKCSAAHHVTNICNYMHSAVGASLIPVLWPSELLPSSSNSPPSRPPKRRIWLVNSKHCLPKPDRVLADANSSSCGAGIPTKMLGLEFVDVGNLERLDNSSRSLAANSLSIL